MSEEINPAKNLHTPNNITLIDKRKIREHMKNLKTLIPNLNTLNIYIKTITSQPTWDDIGLNNQIDRIVNSILRIVSEFEKIRNIYYKNNDYLNANKCHIKYINILSEESNFLRTHFSNRSTFTKNTINNYTQIIRKEKKDLLENITKAILNIISTHTYSNNNENNQMPFHEKILYKLQKTKKFYFQILSKNAKNPLPIERKLNSLFDVHIKRFSLLKKDLNERTNFINIKENQKTIYDKETLKSKLINLKFFCNNQNISVWKILLV